MTPPDEPSPLAPLMPLADPLIPASMEHEPAPTIITRSLPLDYHQDAAACRALPAPGFTPTGVEIAKPTYARSPLAPEWATFHSSPSPPLIPDRQPSESTPPDKPLP